MQFKNIMQGKQLFKFKSQMQFQIITQEKQLFILK